MPAITVKSIPDALFQRLKESAQANHRSVNAEIIACLEKKLMPTKLETKQKLERARSLRAKVQVDAMVDSMEIENAINMGRP